MVLAMNCGFLKWNKQLIDLMRWHIRVITDLMLAWEMMRFVEMV